MAKQEKKLKAIPLKKNAGNINPVLLVNNDEPVVQSQTTSIGYRISSEKISNLLISKPEHNELMLVGLQVLFKLEGVSLDQLKFAQVYYNENPSDEESYFLLEDDFPEEEITFLPEETESIIYNENQLSDESWYTLDPFSTPLLSNDNSHSQLDFYSEDANIAFVYFSIAQLKVLTSFYNDLLISGYQLKLGKKLFHFDSDSAGASRIFPDSNFSLKIEGSSPKFETSIVPNITDVDTSTELNSTEGANVAIGHPCPPKWESFLAVIESIVSANPAQSQAIAANIQVIWRDWASNVYIYTGGGLLADGDQE